MSVLYRINTYLSITPNLQTDLISPGWLSERNGRWYAKSDFDMSTNVWTHVKILEIITPYGSIQHTINVPNSSKRRDTLDAAVPTAKRICEYFEK